jgi:hypothetical protein
MTDIAYSQNGGDYFADSSEIGKVAAKINSR